MVRCRPTLLLALAIAACRSGGQGAGPAESLAPDSEGAFNRSAAEDSVVPTTAFSGDTLEWVVTSYGRPIGRMRQWSDTGLAVVTTFGWRAGTAAPTLRQVARVDARSALPLSQTLTGSDALGSPVVEVVSVADGVLAWRTEWGVSRGAARSFVHSQLGFPEHDAMLARALLAVKSRTVPLYQGGQATLATVGTRKVRGAALETNATLHLISGLDLVPVPVWLDASGRLFASGTRATATIRRGFERAIPQLVAMQDSALRARDSIAVRQLALRPGGALVLRNARLFDPVSRRVRAGVAIVIRGDRVETVARDSGLVVPTGATVVDVRNQFILPGLVDMHARATEREALLHLAGGVTGVRDMTGDMIDGAARRARWARGAALGPSLHLVARLDGPGRFAGLTPAIVATPDSLRAALDRAGEAGVTQLVTAPSLDPRLAALAARDGAPRAMRVASGAVQGALPSRLVRDGVQELQALDVVLAEALADSAYDARTMAQLLAVARRGGTVDLRGPAMTALVAALRARRVAVLPLLSTYETLLTTPPGQLATTHAAIGERLPPMLRSAVRGGGLAVSSPAERRRFQATWVVLQRLAKQLYDAEVPLVIGGGGLPGFQLHREMELLAQIGIPNADVLAAATLGAARALGRDSVEGRIAPGMRATLAIVDGDPLQYMSSLRRTTLVVKDGVVLRPDKLYGALGIAPALVSLPVGAPGAARAPVMARTAPSRSGPAARNVKGAARPRGRAASPRRAAAGSARAATVTGATATDTP
ncbi:MAG: amidohydrolase family protein [Gemmatimonadaceae bacterium]|nr:amidohydrolase family protein [Gemmatimonadaceae bacterium]